MDGSDVDINPVLVGANWYRFRSAQRIHHPRVQSVSFVWVVHGLGVIKARGQSFHLSQNSVLRLPWNHEVEYLADRDSPFHVGTIHVVPDHDLSRPVEARVAVLPDDPLLDVPWRRVSAKREPAVLKSSRSTSGRNLIALASYGVDRFLADKVDEPSLRALGTLIWNEASGWVDGESSLSGRPVMFDLMSDFVLANLHRPIAVSEIAQAGSCSAATAERVFARYAGLSVAAWVRARRMSAAALLLRTTGLRVHEVASRVGYDDPLHFSRVFRSAFGVPPSSYAADQLRP